MERKILKAKDGYIFTNGEIYGEEIYLAEGIDETIFKEIPKEEYRKILEAEENITEENKAEEENE